MITSVIEVQDPQGGLEKVFAGEQERLLNDRASYKVRRSGGAVRIELCAADATALRAVFNSVCKLLVVFEKVKRVAHGSGSESKAGEA